MGCEACQRRPNEQEAKFDVDKFLATFESNLPSFGQYYPSEIGTLIPKKIQEYNSENPLQIGEEYYKNLKGHDMKTVEFKNGNIYQGGWNDDLKMEGQGKYYIKGGVIYVEGIWKNGDLIYARIFSNCSEDSFDVYEGEIKNSNYNGKGKLIESNGKIYVLKYYGSKSNAEVGCSVCNHVWKIRPDHLLKRCYCPKCRNNK